MCRRLSVYNVQVPLTIKLKYDLLTRQQTQLKTLARRSVIKPCTRNPRKQRITKENAPSIS